MDFKIYAVRVFVRDWERAVRFYTETLGMKTTFADAEMGWAELGTGEAHLAIERWPEGESDDEEELVGRYVGVSLTVADVQKSYETLRERGVEFLAPPSQQPWGGVLASFRDPEGNVLTLLGSVSEAD